MSRCKLTKEQVENMHHSWRGNGGRSSLYSLAKRHEITINEAYVVLNTPLAAALQKAARGSYFHAADD